MNNKSISKSVEEMVNILYQQQQLCIIIITAGLSITKLTQNSPRADTADFLLEVFINRVSVLITLLIAQEVIVDLTERQGGVHSAVGGDGDGFMLRNRTSDF